MITYSRQISVLSVALALICCVYAITTSASSVGLTTQRLPTGEETPEGVACDIVRAYIAKDARLYHDSRCKQSCENAFDAKAAYASLLQSQPISMNTQSQSAVDVPDKLKITKVSVRLQPTKNRAVDRRTKNDVRHFDLFVNFGALETRLVDVVTQAPGGHEYLFPVEVMHISDTQRYGRPSGIWQGRLTEVSAILQGR